MEWFVLKNGDVLGPFATDGVTKNFGAQTDVLIWGVPCQEWLSYKDWTRRVSNLTGYEPGSYSASSTNDYTHEQSHTSVDNSGDFKYVRPETNEYKREERTAYQPVDEVESAGDQPSASASDVDYSKYETPSSNSESFDYSKYESPYANESASAETSSDPELEGYKSVMNGGAAVEDSDTLDAPSYEQNENSAEDLHLESVSEDLVASEVESAMEEMPLEYPEEATAVASNENLDLVSENLEEVQEDHLENFSFSNESEGQTAVADLNDLQSLDQALIDDLSGLDQSLGDDLSNLDQDLSDDLSNLDQSLSDDLSNLDQAMSDDELQDLNQAQIDDVLPLETESNELSLEDLNSEELSEDLLQNFEESEGATRVEPIAGLADESLSADGGEVDLENFDNDLFESEEATAVASSLDIENEEAALEAALNQTQAEVPNASFDDLNSLFENEELEGDEGATRVDSMFDLEASDNSNSETVAEDDLGLSWNGQAEVAEEAILSADEISEESTAVASALDLESDIQGLDDSASIDAASLENDLSEDLNIEADQENSEDASDISDLFAESKEESTNVSGEFDFSVESSDASEDSGEYEEATAVAASLDLADESSAQPEEEASVEVAEEQVSAVDDNSDMEYDITSVTEIAQLKDIAKQIENDKAKSEPVEWYVAYEGETDGPITKTQALKKIDEYDVKDFIYLWKDGFADWKNMFDVPEISENLGIGFRRHNRLQVSGTVTIEFAGSLEIGQLDNLSESGIGVTGIDGLKLGDIVKVKLELDQMTTEIEVVAKVRFVSDSGLLGLSYEKDKYAENVTKLLDFVKKQSARKAA